MAEVDHGFSKSHLPENSYVSDLHSSAWDGCVVVLIPATSGPFSFQNQTPTVAILTPYSFGAGCIPPWSAVIHRPPSPACCCLQVSSPLLFRLISHLPQFPQFWRGLHVPLWLDPTLVCAVITRYVLGAKLRQPSILITTNSCSSFGTVSAFVS